ncbi:uncharacterized protein BO72DRAFT_493564 [Aspergillus fijiensis CBS 313.89]|uniref:F-box domain-containing protein n=1 Tax=Aspergillus fijiensis CBS 313.89 TaxID=1448319 RepID=A0A8G1W211_9EURO|nr:uncharacterized protein BO72DRAFT_493564 [Aspergillus fijiensis CBS 313.89]RAK80223.1 hypothetical protein BO72DRAFT_493564 [Aspergillus fijiensis CBS 313.89]
MAETTPHRIFCFPELVKQILLQMDMQTLLVSTRVCYLWHDLFNKSRAIQTALYLQPAENTPRGEPRTANPLIIEKIWPEYFSPCSGPFHKEYYERPEASWRRMLLHQPPTTKLCFLDYARDLACPITPFEAGYRCNLRCPRDGFPRLQDLQEELEARVLRTFDERMIFVEGSPLYSQCRPWGIIQPRPSFDAIAAGACETCDLVIFRDASRVFGGVSEWDGQLVEATAGSLFWIAFPTLFFSLENRRPDWSLKNYHHYVGLDEVPIFPCAEGWRRYCDTIERCHKVEPND